MINFNVKGTNRSVVTVKFRWHLIAMITFIIMALFLTTTCGDDEPTKPGENNIVNTLKFTRQDGTEMTMGSDFAICCAAWESGFDERFVLKIFFYHPEFEGSFWKLFLVVDEISVGTSYSIKDRAAVNMFMVDAPDSNIINELSSRKEESTGTITINSLECDSPLEISFSIDVTVGSELFVTGGAVSVSGNFSATIHSNPSSFGCEFGL